MDENSQIERRSRRSVLKAAATGAGLTMAGQGLAGPAMAEDGAAARRSAKAPFKVISGETLSGGLEFLDGHTILQNCRIEGGGNGVFIGGKASVTLRDCEIVGAAKSGVEITSTGRVQILNCLIHGIGENGVRVVSPRPKEETLNANVLIEGNTIRDIAAPWGDGGSGNCVIVWKADNVQIIANRCSDMVYSSVRVSDAKNTAMLGNHCTGGERDTQVYFEFAWMGAIVANNYIADGSSGFSATNFLTGDGGQAYRGRQAIVTGNRFANFKTFGVLIEGDVLFTNNIIENVDDWGLWAGFGDAVRNLAVTGNLIMGCKYGIALTGSKQSPIIVEGNRFFEVGTPITSLNANWDMILAGQGLAPLSPDHIHKIGRNYTDKDEI